MLPDLSTGLQTVKNKGCVEKEISEKPKRPVKPKDRETVYATSGYVFLLYSIIFLFDS